MKITELLEKSEDQIPHNVWGVEIDSTVLGLPKQLQFMGVIAEFEDEGKTKLSKEFIAKIANLILARTCEIVVEIPADHSLDIKQTVLMANTMQFGLSMLFDETQKEKFITESAEITKVMLSIPNFSQVIHPVSSYLEYLATESLRNEEQRKASLESDEPPKHGVPDDDYIMQVFVLPMSKELVDGFKKATYDAVETHFGSIANFDKAIITSAIAHAEQFRELLEDEKEEADALKEKK